MEYPTERPVYRTLFVSKGFYPTKQLKILRKIGKVDDYWADIGESDNKELDDALWDFCGGKGSRVREDIKDPENGNVLMTVEYKIPSGYYVLTDNSIKAKFFTKRNDGFGSYMDDDKIKAVFPEYDDHTVFRALKWRVLVDTDGGKRIGYICANSYGGKPSNAEYVIFRCGSSIAVEIEKSRLTIIPNSKKMKEILKEMKAV